MSVRTVDEFEQRLEAYAIERSEEARAVRVGEKDVSEQAAIVARYADLFTREQLVALRDAEEGAGEDEREAVARLRLTCQEGIVTAELAEREDALENALLADTRAVGRPELPLRAAQARLAVEPDYARRGSLGDAILTASAALNDDRRDLLTARNELESQVTGIADPVARNEAEKGVRSARSSTLSTRRASRRRRRSRRSASAGSTGCSAPIARRRRRAPTWHGSGGSPRSSRRTRRSAACPVCLATLHALGFDLEGREGDPHRPRRPAAEVARVPA